MVVDTPCSPADTVVELEVPVDGDVDDEPEEPTDVELPEVLELSLLDDDDDEEEEEDVVLLQSAGSSQSVVRDEWEVVVLQSLPSSQLVRCELVVLQSLPSSQPVEDETAVSVSLKWPLESGLVIVARPRSATPSVATIAPTRRSAIPWRNRETARPTNCRTLRQVAVIVFTPSSGRLTRTPS